MEQYASFCLYFHVLNKNIFFDVIVKVPFESWGTLHRSWCEMSFICFMYLLYVCIYLSCTKGGSIALYIFKEITKFSIYLILRILYTNK